MIFQIKSRLVGRDNNDGTTTVSGKCVITKKEYEVTVPRDGLIRWMNGTTIQNALPELSRPDAEFLITRTSPEGWESTFGPMEEEEV